MMYIVIAQRGDSTKTVELQWHVGEKNPLRNLPDNFAFSFEDVIEVQADLDELDYIHTEFTNLPQVVRGAGIVHWFGDHAKFIAANLT